MENSLEHKALFNSAFCATLIFEAVNEFNRRSSSSREMNFELGYLVLPICMNREASTVISGLNSPGILLRALAQHPQLLVGLQSQVIRYAKITEEAIFTAQLARLVDIEISETKSDIRFGLYPLRATRPINYTSEDSKIRLACAKRLGAAFEEVGSKTATRFLNLHW